MKKRNGLFLTILSAVLAISAMFILTACGGKSLNSVSIGRNDMPRLNYVQGQDLDLSEGVLTLEYSDGTIETLPLDSDEISVSGYDANLTGKQTVTVSYKDVATSFEVSVIARVTVVNAQTVYYVGETLDTSKGSISVANDDASTYQVYFSDASISFQGFDSSKATDKQTITVIYTKDGTEYKGSFDITVYTTDNAKLTPFIKTSYYTHEKFRVNGAYITYSNGNPSQNKNIPVTEDMISGIDFSLVNETNSPMEQTGVVTYGGREYPFTITVTYSEVTRLQRMLEEYDFSWTGPEIPVVDETQGLRAEDCVELYLTLSDSEREYVDAATIETAIRTAIAYSYGLWNADLQSCDESFSIDADGLVYHLSSYEAAKADAVTVSDDTAAINTEVDFLKDMIREFGEVTIGGVKAAEYLSAVSVYADDREQLSDLLAFSAELYETLIEVPENWSDLSAYVADIDKVKELVTEGTFGSAEYRNVFAQVSYWRKNNDLFDIVYNYYYQKEDDASIEQMKNIILPAKLNDLYQNIVYAISEYSAIYVGTGSGYSSDSTFMVYYYQNACDIASDIEANGSDWLKDLYNSLAFDNLLISAEGDPLPATFADLFTFVEFSPYGYYDLLGGVVDDSALVSVWKTYLELLDATTQEEAEEKIKAFIDEFAALSPARQKSFLYSVNVYYDGYEKPALDTDGNYTYLVRILTTYYTEVLSEEEFEAFRNLLLTMESYSGIGENVAYAKDFLYYVSEMQADYEKLEDKKAFDDNFGKYYQKYVALAALYNEDGTLKEDFVIGAEWQQVFDEIVKEIDRMIDVDKLIWETDETVVQQAYIRLFASYEKVRSLVDSIFANAPEEVKSAYYQQTMLFDGKNEWTLDYALNMFAEPIAVMHYNSLMFADASLWELVGNDAALRQFIEDALPIVWTEETDETTMAAADVVAVMKKYLTLSDMEKILFLQLQGIDENHVYYYDGIAAVFAKVFSGNEKLTAALDALLNAEGASVNYVFATTQGTAEDVSTALEALRTAMSELDTALAALSETELAQFNGYFAEILSYYESAYDLIPEA